ncbi:Mif2/CENP-C like-domain-containing protein [Irpex rosettiformis]|uniref:Mif2/CENP-C like-domain-containing protein n=1 Tax=Irpex rosettiformis TaxID=378272 RepID=A0ACB8UHG1_9APHY|nr:Mif2/CENP-C like-domain-containing protein [Irpex rosettiformis]
MGAILESLHSDQYVFRNSGLDELHLSIKQEKINSTNMPVSARKSSLGALTRRGPQKYIRYRADDLQHGKRTGIAVGYVDRDSDEFEPFEKVIGQADLRTPPKPHMPARKRKSHKTPVVEEEEFDDEDGEMSMEIDDSHPYSPATYLASGMHSITASVQRPGSAPRSVQRRSVVEFERIPSPRRDSFLSSLSSNRSKGQTSYSRASNLSRSVIPEEVPEAEPIEYSPPPEDYNLGSPPRTPIPEEESDNERTPRANQRPSSVRSRASLFQTNDEQDELQDEEDEEEEDEVETHMTAKSTKVKGKSRGVEVEQEPEQEHEQDVDMEPEIAQGLDDIDQMPEDQFDQDDEGAVETQTAMVRQRGEDNNLDKDPRPNKRGRKENVNEKEVQKKPRGRPRKQDTVLREVIHDQNIDDEDEDGLRRGKRMRYKPLEWWRCEKVVYGRRDSGTSYVPTIKEIRRLPKEEVKPLGGKHRRKRPPRSKSHSVTVEPGILERYNPEEGWDDDTDPMGVVLQYPTDQEVTQRVAFTAKMVNPKPAANAQFSFQKIFGDGNFMAAGQLVIPPGGSKPTKGTKDNTFIFYVLEGAVTFKVHRTSFVLATGGMFLVPRGNMYYIQNISDRDAKLFFAQARKVEAGEESRSPSKSRTPMPRQESVDEEVSHSRVPSKHTKKRL